MYRRALLIYVLTIVVPASALLALGVESFERQRHSLAALEAEKLAAALDARLRAAAQLILTGKPHPAAQYFFTLNRGEVIEPAIYSPPPAHTPAEFADAEREELDLNRPDVALGIYRQIANIAGLRPLALSRVARCLGKIGRADESRLLWQEIAAKYSDEQDLAHRPFGIVAAIEAGDTVGLLEKINGGRWNLPADQADYFTSELHGQPPPRFAFARELRDRFHPEQLHEDEIYSYAFGPYHIFYTAEAGNRIRGFSVNQAWVDRELRPQVVRELNFAQPNGLALYGGAIVLILSILGAGVFLLARDISRESGMNRLRSGFVSSVSHELKTPITLIRLYAETLLERDSLGAKERRDSYRIIVRESDRLTRLVNGILTFSRIERGDRIYNFEAGDAAPVVARTVEDYREYVENAGFRLETAIPAESSEVRFDRAALSQALINLLDNAMKYSADRREIAVRVFERNAAVVAEVEDHGIGIPQCEQNRIFEPFYRVANGHGKGGYGLGLHLVRHVMEAHGGRVEMDSEPGRGARFRLVLPMVKA